MSFNYKIIIEYDGTDFVGWQIQKNGRSVQEVIQKTIKKLIKENIILFGSGRTDAGVHAIGQTAHFITKFKIKDKNSFISSINFFLSKYNISILNIEKKDLLFNARYSAKERVYRYLILNRLGSLAINKNRVWHIKNKLDINIMKKGAKLLEGTKDFSTFRASSCGAKSPIRSMKKVKIIKKENLIEITFISKSFLQQQVRSMVGCLKYLGENKWTHKEFNQIIKSKTRSNCASPAPAQGLYLLKVKY